ncbi:MAG: hypothetical protein M3261_00375 [Thermoproteota archaeon]|nr:hypothetical protein [Thermoproteota archaeon]
MQSGLAEIDSVAKKKEKKIRRCLIPTTNRLPVLPTRAPPFFLLVAAQGSTISTLEVAAVHLGSSATILTFFGRN